MHTDEEGLRNEDGGMRNGEPAPPQCNRRSSIGNRQSPVPVPSCRFGPAPAFSIQCPVFLAVLAPWRLSLVCHLHRRRPAALPGSLNIQLHRKRSAERT